MLTVIDEGYVNHEIDADYCVNEDGILVAMKDELPVQGFNIGNWKKWYINAETVRKEKQYLD